jgi:hypothetical protein
MECGIGLTGVMAALTAPLRDAQVPIFVISTWCVSIVAHRVWTLRLVFRDTDWLLVGKDLLEDAREALSADGWVFAD